MGGPVPLFVGRGPRDAADPHRPRAGALRSQAGGADREVTLSAGLAAPCHTTDEEVLAVDAALDRLSARDERLARLVELRFFGGLEVDEAADALGISPRTAARAWARAKAHLRADLA